jgi:uridine kinase
VVIQGAAVELREAIDGALRAKGGPVVVALDGRGSVGKSTLAEVVARSYTRSHGTTVIDGDDFYNGPPPGGWVRLSPAERADQCIDWKRQLAVLFRLTSGVEARWHPYDWDREEPSPQWRIGFPAPVIILDGTFSARPELHEVLTLRALLITTPEEQVRRFGAREDRDAWQQWSNTWSSAEDHYFREVMPPYRFDHILEG